MPSTGPTVASALNFDNLAAKIKWGYNRKINLKEREEEEALERAKRDERERQDKRK